MDEFSAFVVGLFMSFFIMVGLLIYITPEISEAELLRFCMDHDIKRKECVIKKEQQQ